MPLAIICPFTLSCNDLSIVTLQLIKHSECDVEREEKSPWRDFVSTIIICLQLLIFCPHFVFSSYILWLHFFPISCGGLMLVIVYRIGERWGVKIDNIFHNLTSYLILRNIKPHTHLPLIVYFYHMIFRKKRSNDNHVIIMLPLVLMTH